jgi:hypothetical protein
MIDQLIEVSDDLIVSWYKNDYIKTVMKTVGCKKCNSDNCKNDCFLKNKIVETETEMLNMEQQVLKIMTELV